ncbi:MAG: hypothetical protein EPO32_07200 [Anaerolineae bacterium]|nr:MAG: hypothetical protein EPO32_07200 [Anaerolineae bacterium]
MKTLKPIILVLSTGYICVYFSEHLFWARVRPDDSPANWLMLWVAYSLVAFVFLALVQYFRVRNIWALFLAGAAYGWLLEGVVVQTTYEMLPLSISFTGLAWHALITIWIGWYLIQKTFISSSVWSALRLFVLIGFLYGLWAIYWRLDPDGGVATIPEFALFSLTTTALVIFAYGLANWSLSSPFTINRWGIGFVGFLFAPYFFFVTVPAAPSAILILPFLLLSVYLGLRWNRSSERQGSLLDTFHGQVPLWKYVSMMTLPGTGICVYALALSLNLHWYTNWVLYIITTPLGFVVFGMSLYKLLKNRATVIP